MKVPAGIGVPRRRLIWPDSRWAVIATISWENVDSRSHRREAGGEVCVGRNPSAREFDRISEPV